MTRASIDPAPKTLDDVRALVRAECARESNRFGPDFFDLHLVQVARYAGALAAPLGADLQVVELAAYLHDLAAVRDLRTVPTHHLDGALIARELLASGGWPAATIDAVSSCIEAHSTPVERGRGTAEALCLSNADVLSHVARPAYWLFYAFGVRGFSHRDGVAWLRSRAETAWGRLTPEAQRLAGVERERLIGLLDGSPRAATP